MLIKCPECQLQVSDRAWTCPHCGYPLKADMPKPRKTTRRKRLPNGFGQISEIKGKNLRKPFRVLVTVGKDESGRPICKPLRPESYFKTYNEAYIALVEYNKNPYDLTNVITMQELFDRWYKYKQKDGPCPIWNSTWRYCSSLYGMKVRDVRTRHLKRCMEEASLTENGVVKEATPNIKRYIKSLFNMLFDYAVEYEITDVNYARNFLTKSVEKTSLVTIQGHIPYSDDELEMLWKNINPYNIADMIIIQCYTGWRPNELCSIKLSDIDLENMTIIGGMKTQAGINRVVPIHSKIRELVLDRYRNAESSGFEYLFNDKKPITVKRYNYQFTKIIDKLDFEKRHRPHDGRVTFVTKAKKYKVDEYAIKYMVGHAIQDITEKVYTQRSIDWLKTEIEKIK